MLSFWAIEGEYFDFRCAPSQKLQHGNTS